MICRRGTARFVGLLKKASELERMRQVEAAVRAELEAERRELATIRRHRLAA
jgi:hypothetical protein